ncbi:MAG: glycosyltransferase [Gemmatimonadaceae bacterium]|nr:glycosyltransferase [Gemmatimonadaceae bacterium]
MRSRWRRWQTSVCRGRQSCSPPVGWSRRKGSTYCCGRSPLFTAQCPTRRLRIVGEGTERARLEALRASLDLPPDVVEFPGRTASMSIEYQRAGMFVLSSRFEGFPNALARRWPTPAR